MIVYPDIRLKNQIPVADYNDFDVARCIFVYFWKKTYEEFCNAEQSVP
jgi:hypothetical protein